MNSLLIPAETTNILYGAIVGGPSKADFYVDDRIKYNSTEVKIGLNYIYTQVFKKLFLKDSFVIYIGCIRL
jgi:hypothetical protein